MSCEKTSRGGGRSVVEIEMKRGGEKRRREGGEQDDEEEGGSGVLGSS